MRAGRSKDFVQSMYIEIQYIIYGITIYAPNFGTYHHVGISIMRYLPQYTNLRANFLANIQRWNWYEGTGGVLHGGASTKFKKFKLHTQPFLVEALQLIKYFK